MKYIRGSTYRVSSAASRRSSFGADGKKAMQSSASLLRSTYRIMSNLVAASLVLLSLVTIVVLLSTGMFHRRAIINDLSYDDSYTSPYGQACRMTDAGFVAGSCTDVEVATMGGPAWVALGGRLAQQWQATAASPYFVTTCIKGPRDDDSAWAALMLVAGYDAFPLCRATGQQDIAGMAMVETTVRDEYPTGAYIVTAFADKTMADASRVHTNSDGTTDIVIAHANQSLISTRGIVSDDNLGINTVENSLPLGSRYMVTAFAYATVLDITDHMAADSSLMPWRNVGRVSKKAVTITWDTGHDVARSAELVVLQLAFSLAALGLMSSDVYLTVQGLKGLLKKKPVMTFDLLAGLERRRLLVLTVALASAPSLLYTDVARIYFSTTNGDLIWYLATILIGIFVAFSTVLVFSIVQLVPSPSGRVVTYSPAVFFYGTILSMEAVWSSEYTYVAEEFNNAAYHLALNVSGTYRPSGAYKKEGIDTAMNLMAAKTFVTLGACLLASILFSTCRRKVFEGSCLMRTDWTKTNGFLDRCRPPRWVTGLPLGQMHAIKIGNKLICKPSMQVVMGFATVAPATSDTGCVVASATDETKVIISVYHLLPTLLRIYQRVLPTIALPRVFGTVTKNEFVRGNSRPLPRSSYVHDRGVCIN